MGDGSGRATRALLTRPARAEFAVTRTAFRRERGERAKKEDPATGALQAAKNPPVLSRCQFGAKHALSALGKRNFIEYWADLPHPRHISNDSLKLGLRK
jgi:hypothetical protein